MKGKKPASPRRGSTQDFVELHHIKDDVALFKNNSACILIRVGTTNFALLSQEEQYGLIYSYASLLNSLSFPVQVVILSKKTHISSYMEHIDEHINTQIHEVLKKRLVAYKEFIKSLVTKNTVLEKQFYCVILFSPLELGLAASTKKTFSKEYLITRAKTSLYPKRDHLLRILEQAGLTSRVLVDHEIAELFYNMYNPSSIGRKLASPLSEYTRSVSNTVPAKKIDAINKEGVLS